MSKITGPDENGDYLVETHIDMNLVVDSPRVMGRVVFPGQELEPFDIYEQEFLVETADGIQGFAKLKRPVKE